MYLNGPDTDVKLFADFSVGVALGDEAQNLFLPQGQGLGSIMFFARRTLRFSWFAFGFHDTLSPLS